MTTLYQVPFLCGDGSGEILLDVVYIADFARGYDSTCAFCHGDPCNELGDRIKGDTHISAYFVRNSTAETCPCCKGAPT